MKQISIDTFQLIGGVIWLLFYGIYFAKLIGQRRKGIQANLLAKGQKPAETVQVEKMLHRSAFAIGIIQCCSLIMGNWNLLTYNPMVRYIGFGLAGLGTLIFIIAIVTMRDNWRVGVDTSKQITLITSGIYRYSRNPAFVGFDLLYVGFAMAFPNGILAAVSFMGIVMMHLQILEEEKFLSQNLGTVYDEYRKRTPRYIF